MADFIYKEVTSLLKSRAKAQKSTAEGLTIANRKIKKRMLEIDGEVNNMRKINVNRNNEVIKVKQNIEKFTEEHSKIVEVLHATN